MPKPPSSDEFDDRLQLSLQESYNCAHDGCDRGEVGGLEDWFLV